MFLSNSHFILLKHIGTKKKKKSFKMIGGQIHLEIYRRFDYKI